MALNIFKSKKSDNLYTIAFYNLENLFDTKNHAHTLDDDFTPGGKKKWTKKRYRKKIKKLSKIISKLGTHNNTYMPVIVGVAEVENKKVLDDLIDADALKHRNMAYVHYDSPDERGIDTALLYRDKQFKVVHSEAIPLHINNLDGQPDATRDILYVKGELNGESFHILVNHWPSKRSGDEETSYKRIAAANRVLELMDTIKNQEEDPHFILMGDFNDGPKSESIKHLVESADLYNPMEKLLTPDRGSANYKFTWGLFDQILVSHNLFDHRIGTHSFSHANIFDAEDLKEWKGRFRGIPFRTYAGKKYLGGYSDHFPVYIQLSYKN